MTHLIFLLENVDPDCQKKSTEQIVFSNKNDICTGFMTNIKDDRKTNM